MSKMGDSEIAKQWFQLMAEEALLEKKQKITERKWLLEKQEAQEAKALKTSTLPATIKCSSNSPAALRCQVQEQRLKQNCQKH
jgi:hypothetical protein